MSLSLTYNALRSSYDVEGTHLVLSSHSVERFCERVVPFLQSKDRIRLRGKALQKPGEFLSPRLLCLDPQEALARLVLKMHVPRYQPAFEGLRFKKHYKIGSRHLVFMFAYGSKGRIVLVTVWTNSRDPRQGQRDRRSGA